MSERLRVVLALTPVAERAIEELVFGSEAAVTPVASAPVDRYRSLKDPP